MKHQNNIFALSIVAFAAFLVFMPDAALAAPTPAASYTNVEKVLCNALSFVMGPIGKGIAAFAIIMIGVSLFLGKVSWGLGISTALGIGAIFGAPGIVAKLGGGAALDVAACAGDTSASGS
jgi:type IV secretion system protein VirB2